MLKEHEAELLSAYMDNELTGEEMTLVQENLTASHEWREELEKLKQTKQMTMDLPRMIAPTDLLDFLENEGNRRLNKREGFWNFLSFPSRMNWAWGSSMALVLVALGIVGGHRLHENSFIPMEALVAAHAHGNTRTVFHQNIVNVSQYSSQIRNNAQIK